jgi:hypothetical protein
MAPARGSPVLLPESPLVRTNLRWSFEAVLTIESRFTVVAPPLRFNSLHHCRTEELRRNITMGVCESEKRMTQGFAPRGKVDIVGQS